MVTVVPPGRFGRRVTRHVPDDALLRVTVRLPAPMVRDLRTVATDRGCTVAFLVHTALVDAGYSLPDTQAGGDATT